MKLALIYNPNEPKLTPTGYSQSYRDMLTALSERFEEVRHVHESCPAGALGDPDVVVFFDLHSSHHISIAGLEKTKAVKYEYFNDPHQKEQRGRFSSGYEFHKLGAEQRCRRARQRGAQFIICPYRNGYDQYLRPQAGDMELFWFPVAPKPRRRTVSLLTDRLPEVLGNGHLWQGEPGFRPYEFRRWAFARSEVTHVSHTLQGRGTPAGSSYASFLSQYAAVLALCDTYVVPKYLEVPLAGCLCFAQQLPDYDSMGMKPGRHYVRVDRDNFDQEIRTFLGDIAAYQTMADAGRRQIAEHWTASHFAEALYRHAQEYR